MGSHSNLVQGIHAIGLLVFDARGVCAALDLVGTSDAPDDGAGLAPERRS